MEEPALIRRVSFLIGNLLSERLSIFVKMYRSFTFLFFLFLPFFSFANDIDYDTLKRDSSVNSTDLMNIHVDHVIQTNWKYRFVEQLKKKAGENDKVVAAILAFPLFGIIGLHRIYLGTKPYVPVVYIATLGGCAGVLPLIDFFAIIFANKETFDCYKENPKVFMWIK
jgi:hypothetical protein